MIFGGNGTLNAHPRPLPRKTSALDAYYRNGLAAGLAGLGTTFSDLPNQGRNLRLYSYDPPGTPYYKPPEQGGFQYNTGHYDITLAGGPCSQVDAQGFNDVALMNAYAAQRGEMLVLVTRADLSALCAARPPAAVVAPPPPVVTPTAPTPSPYTQPSGVPTPTTVHPCPEGYVFKSGGCYPPGVPPTVAPPPAAPTKTTTTTTSTSSTGGGGGGGRGTGGGGGGAAPAPIEDNTLLIVGLVAVAFLVLSK